MDKKDDQTDFRLLYQAFAVVGVIWFLSLLVVGIVPCLGGSREGAGQFGDAFGVVNTLFSGLAFAAVFFSIYLQRNELRESLKQFTISAKAGVEAEHALGRQIKASLTTAKLSALGSTIQILNTAYADAKKRFIRLKRTWPRGVPGF